MRCPLETGIDCSNDCNFSNSSDSKLSNCSAAQLTECLFHWIGIADDPLSGSLESVALAIDQYLPNRFRSTLRFAIMYIHATHGEMCNHVMFHCKLPLAVAMRRQQ